MGAMEAGWGRFAEVKNGVSSVFVIDLHGKGRGEAK